MDIQEEDRAYDDLFIKYPEQSGISISEAYQAIEELMIEAENYFQVKLFLI